MSLDADMIALIDQRIRSNTAMTKAIGTCVARDTTGNGAQVIFDGSTVAMPVRVLGHVFVQSGMRCVLDKYGSDWIVTGSFAQTVAFGESSTSANGPVGGTGALSSSTFIDLNELAPLTFTKVYDNTFVRFGMLASCYLSAGTLSNVVFALRVTALDASMVWTATDISMNMFPIDQLGQHYSTYRATRQGSTMPAGPYSLQVRWRRSAGTGNFKANDDDQFEWEADERVSFETPIL